MPDYKADFKRKVLKEADLGKKVETRECYGMSNSAKFVTGGFLCGIPNIDGLGATADALCIFSMIPLSPSTEMHMAIIIRKDLHLLRDRMNAMVEAAPAGFFANKNNNCAFFLYSDEKIYTYNKAKVTFELSAEIIERLSPGIEPDALFLAIYGEDISAEAGPVAQLITLIGSDKLRRIGSLTEEPEIPELQVIPQFGPVQREQFRQELEKQEVGFQTADNLPENLINSLAVKPFVILTGNSGTGKTKLAEYFAQWLSGGNASYLTLVPVGANWTDNRNILGFVNHLRLTKLTGEEGDEVPIYQSTRVLDLLLAANNQKDKPFFLILDEMNLSHVERYFSDFLSIMESRNGEFLLHREGRLLPRKPGGTADVPESLTLPSNVFIIGTVNVDETTYMFSPKVLDRANVLEFRLAHDAAIKFFESGGRPLGNIASAPNGYSEGFLELSYRARGLNSLTSLTLVKDPAKLLTNAAEGLKKCHQSITDLFDLMQQRHQEFAFRPMSEIIRFLAVDYELTHDDASWDWQAAMDAQILQKILPKLHGSKRKIGPLLTALATYCEKGDLADAKKLLDNEIASDAYVLTGEKNALAPIFKNSHFKLREMIQSVRRDQFVSFIQ